MTAFRCTARRVFIARFTPGMKEMREKLTRFMVGRNGNDALNRFLLGLDIVLLILSMVFTKGLGRVLTPIAFVLLGWTYYRMFSRNVLRRSEENAHYLRIRDQILGRARVSRDQWNQRKEYKFFTCPSCKAVMRVPKGRGKIKIVCRKCGTSFMGKS